MGNCVSNCSESIGKQESDENVVYVVEEHDDDDGELTPNERSMRRLASLYSQKGKKGTNQDAAIICKGYGMEGGVFCGVFDGHGRSGHLVSKMVRDYLPTLLLDERNVIVGDNEDSDFAYGNDSSSMDSQDSSGSSPDMFDEWKEACVNAFRTMDQQLKIKLGTNSSYSGSTAVSIIKQRKDLIISNLGDSRAIMGSLSEDGHLEAIQLTTDLKPDIPEEAARIRKSNGRIFALKDEPHVFRVWLPYDDSPGLAMARAFGDFQLKKHGVISIPQVSYRRLTKRDQFIVLATDGVWDALSNEQVVSIVWSTKRKEDASKALVEAAVKEWKSKFPFSRVDDCSAICLFLKDHQE